MNYPLILRSGPPRAEMKRRRSALWESCCCPSYPCSANRGHQFVVLSVWHLAWWVLNLLKIQPHQNEQWAYGKAKRPESEIMRGTSGASSSGWFPAQLYLVGRLSSSLCDLQRWLVATYVLFCLFVLSFVFYKSMISLEVKKEKVLLTACSKTLLNKPPCWLCIVEN